MKLKSLLLTAALCSQAAFATNVTIGEQLPATSVDDKGLLMLENDEFSYRNWQTSELKGKVFVLQVMAGRTDAIELNDPMIQAITDAQFPGETFQMVTIINTDDAIWGTSLFVKGAIEDNKREHPYAEFVVDDSSKVHKFWELEKESSAIIILDKQGRVLYVKDGAMNSQEVTSAIDLIKANS